MQMFAKSRRGFIRLAMQVGASIVPVISFCEAGLYELIEYKTYSSVAQTLCRLILMVSNIYNTILGVLPKRHPITVVVGAANHVEKNQHSSENELNRLHAVFCTRLIDLFETRKSEYVKNSEKNSFGNYLK